MNLILVNRIIFVILFLSLFLHFGKTRIQLDSDELIGIYPPVFTPITYDNTYRLNLSVIEPYARYLKRNGIKGVLVSGTTGEGPVITIKERKLLLDAWLRIARVIDLRVMVQVAGMTFKDSLEMARYAGRSGVDAILALPEFYYRPRSVSSLVWYVKQIANQAPNTPILYYDIPVTGVLLNMVEFFDQATCQIQNFVGLKTPLLTGIQVMAHIRLQPQHRIFILTDQALMLALAIGCSGTISGSAGFFPDDTTAIVEAVRRGDLFTARDLQRKVNERIAAIAYFDEIDETSDTVSSLKAAMEMVTGIYVGPPRPPLPTVGIEKKRAIAKQLIELGVDLTIIP